MIVDIYNNFILDFIIKLLLKIYYYKIFTFYTDSLVKFMEAMGYDPNIIALVPTMTSNTAPSGVASASNEGEGAAYRAFDGNDTTIWQVSTGISQAQIGYKFTSPVCVKKVSIYATSNRIGTFKIQGRNENSSWVDLTDVVTSNKQTSEEVMIKNPNYYSQYQLNILSTTSDRVFINTLQFYGKL